MTHPATAPAKTMQDRTTNELTRRVLIAAIAALTTFTGERLATTHEHSTEPLSRIEGQLNQMQSERQDIIQRITRMETHLVSIQSELLRLRDKTEKK